MGRYTGNYDEYIIAKVLKAYLEEGQSHRNIQKDILNLPAPPRGGGFVAMDILHSFNIKGEHKGILKNTTNKETISYYKDIVQGIELVNNLNIIESEAINKIKNKEYKFKTQETTKNGQIKIRVNQSILRKIVLDNYNHSCALCDINKEDLLICSHIKPWAVDEEERLNPENAICLCVMHDKLFDRGYFGLNENYEIIRSGKVDPVIENLIKNLSFKKPKNHLPNTHFLKYHSEEICSLK